MNALGGLAVASFSAAPCKPAIVLEMVLTAAKADHQSLAYVPSKSLLFVYLFDIHPMFTGRFSEKMP